MTEVLPLFPLGLVVFPGEKLNLHIFEPRYKQLINDCQTDGITFGIPAYINGKLMNFGTEVELLSIEKLYDNGEMDIKTRGIGVYKMFDFYSMLIGKFYAGGDVKRLVYDFHGNPALNDEILEMAAKIFKLLNIQKPLPCNDDMFNTFSIAHHVGFDLEKEYEFLIIDKEVDRQHFMMEHLERMMPIIDEMDRLRERALMNGHFKHLIPPRV